MEVGIPGRRAICARHLEADTGETSMWYVRPAIFSSYRWTVTFEDADLTTFSDGFKRSAARKRPIHCLWRLDQSGIRITIIFRVATSTSFRPFIHRFSTLRV